MDNFGQYFFYVLKQTHIWPYISKTLKNNEKKLVCILLNGVLFVFLKIYVTFFPGINDHGVRFTQDNVCGSTS